MIIPVHTGHVVPFGLGRVPISEYAAVARVLESSGARITAAEISVDVLGVPAAVAADAIVPALVLAGDGRAGDVVSHSASGATYHRRRGASRNLVHYSDKPSKQDPDGDRVLHVELRLRGRWLRAERLHRPRSLTAMDRRRLRSIFERHVDLVEVLPDRLPFRVSDAVHTHHLGNASARATAAAVVRAARETAFDGETSGVRSLGMPLNALVHMLSE